MENRRARLGESAPRIQLVTGDRIAATAQVELPPIPGHQASLHPEFDLLLAACGLTSHFKFEELVASPLDWELLLRLADQHRVLPALHQRFSRSTNAPATIRCAVNARYEKHALKALRFSAELLRVARHLGEYGIPVLAHKGPTLSQMLFEDAAQRQFVDLDFLVRASDVSRARLALAELGYEPRLRLSKRKEQEYLRSGYEYVFGLNKQRTLLELQWQVLPRFYAVDFDIEKLFERSVALEFEGFTTRALRQEDLTLVVCMHAAKHCWAQLAMLRDLAALSRRDLNWDWILSEARRLGIMRIIQISFLLTHDLLGSPLPFMIIPRDVRRIAQTIRSQLATGAEVNPESFAYYRFMMHVRERRRDRARFAWRLATTPTLGEWDSVSIPDTALFLYCGVRMFRLARRLIS